MQPWLAPKFLAAFRRPVWWPLDSARGVFVSL
jgi:hypothetical protein